MGTQRDEREEWRSVLTMKAYYLILCCPKGGCCYCRRSLDLCLGEVVMLSQAAILPTAGLDSDEIEAKSTWLQAFRLFL